LGIGDWGLGIGPNPQSPCLEFNLINSNEKYYKNNIILKKIILYK
jgi:hypothetical protein